MNRIYLAAGLIIVCILLVGGWFFVVGLGEWSQMLGEKSKDTVGSEEMKFVGVWYGEPDFGLISFSSTGSFRKGVFDGAWKLESGVVQLHGLDGKQYWTSYTYSFFNDDMHLILTEPNTNEIIDLKKQE